MRRFPIGRGMLLALGLTVALGAAPAAPSYHAVSRTIDDIRRQWKQPGAREEPNAPGWNAFLDALLAEFKAHSGAASEGDRLASLNRLYEMAVALNGVSWSPAIRVRNDTVELIIRTRERSSSECSSRCDRACVKARCSSCHGFSPSTAGSVCRCAA